ncbi:G/U mismatch-specific DNA glycosylase [Actinosynnema pretiosum]|uniref:G/U mismatch-specific DNA glycosylase n=1 Tax=Actinosynnema pretiosum TaxID=42197 RepID=UPI0028120F4E|nr:G/U mismatch-specific DNA glycosylase [Actinosynnema pretiosum]
MTGTPSGRTPPEGSAPRPARDAASGPDPSASASASARDAASGPAAEPAPDPGPLPDLLAPGLSALLCGINPGGRSAVTGHHYAGPGNRFWRVLHLAGFTPRLLAPSEQALLPVFGIGLTNLVARPTARAAELGAAELVAGAGRLTGLVERHRPGAVAVVGVSAYRVAFRRPRAVVGPQDVALACAPLWVLPNPSGLNAGYRLDDLVAIFRDFRSELPQPAEHPLHQGQVDPGR